VTIGHLIKAALPKYPARDDLWAPSNLPRIFTKGMRPVP
jgi:hypothetical protein